MNQSVNKNNKRERERDVECTNKHNMLNNLNIKITDELKFNVDCSIKFNFYYKLNHRFSETEKKD